MVTILKMCASPTVHKPARSLAGVVVVVVVVVATAVVVVVVQSLGRGARQLGCLAWQARRGSSPAAPLMVLVFA